MTSDLTASFEILGSGTSFGVPYPGCFCPVCTSTDPHDNRMRQCALIRVSDGTNILIDSGCEVRLQLLRSKVKKIDYVLYTHSHADHIHGLDDLTVLAKKREIKLFMNQYTLPDIKNRFHYLFKDTGAPTRKTRMTLNLIDEKPFNLGKVLITPIPLFHGKLVVYGYRIGNIAYCTDTNQIPPESLELLKGVEIFFIDGLRDTQHPTHFSYSEALDIVAIIKPKIAYLIHIAHNNSHVDIEKFIQNKKIENPDLNGIEIHPAFDGLLVENFNL
ncbi:hypothetical protein M9Y10_009930 [Tritrichomonas musculus]|uniref:Metallo-beta-lactamase domain-containing protein n=1 Tax=Tritrichomonas musculus TaxID=1915356 RepID=A0ABR2IPW9_9EUKA